ncbi:MAG TPA: alpha/beta fold hydrolase [Candidatus Sulfotelmatobacter sp.]|nr:alpha/beta fold hydrolase [Candidatus Sulfotelmatobacter sp.]HEV2468251.1 alpha/beta fold hydrolase [Candidatus Sulfotelmatobacter sp.]
MPSSTREFADRTADPHVVGFLHSPETPNGDGLVLTHGAGGSAQAPLLRALADTFAHAGYTVLRGNLPYRQTRSFGPPGPADAARDRAGLKNAIAALKENLGGPPYAGFVGWGQIYLAGHSYGGRQASMLCAEEPGLVPALLLLSYPLHPPRRPEQQRTQHLPDLRTPTLFVSGTRDPFGSIEELQKAMKMIPAKTRLLPVEGAGHDLGFKGKEGKNDLPNRILSEFATFVRVSS